MANRFMLSSIAIIFVFASIFCGLVQSAPLDKESGLTLLCPTSKTGRVFFNEGAAITLASEGIETDSTSPIKFVEYVADGSKVVGKAEKYPYIASWKPKPGEYTLKARAVLDNGQTISSSSQTITVPKDYCSQNYEVENPYYEVPTSPKTEEKKTMPKGAKLRGVSVPKGMRVTSEKLPSITTGLCMDNLADNKPLLYGDYKAYLVSGKVPGKDAKLVLDLSQNFALDLLANVLRIFRFDKPSRRWIPLESKVCLSYPDKYAAISANISKPGIYTVSVINPNDNEPPTLYWIFPEEGKTLDGPTESLFSVADNVVVESIDYSLNDRNIVDDSGGHIWELSGMDGKWGETVDFSHYVTGKYTLTISASDGASNYTEISRQVNIHSDIAFAPKVSLGGIKYDPAEKAALITGTVTVSDSKIDKENLELAIDIGGEEPLLGWVTFDDYDADNWVCKMDYFPPGQHKMAVKVHDEYGNVGTAEMIVSLPLSSLKVDSNTFDEPQPTNKPVIFFAAALGGNVVEYRFEVSSDGGKSWTALQDFSSSYRYTWTPAKAGDYKIRATAREKSEPSRQVSGEMTYEVTPK